MIIKNENNNFYSKKASVALPILNKYKKDMMPSIYSVRNKQLEFGGTNDFFDSKINLYD